MLGLIFAFAEGPEDPNEPNVKEAAEPNARQFSFTYRVQVTEVPPGVTARVWIPLAPTTDEQDVTIVRIDTPTEARRETEKRYGNELAYFEAEANEQGEIPLSVEYQVTRKALTPAGSPAGMIRARDFLAGSALVPVNGTVLKRFYSQKPAGKTRDLARRLYDQVDGHMKYDKTGEGWGRGDVLWACDSRHGNCSDFHSLFIALCRDVEIPALFEIGFPLPVDKGSGSIAGYHCWAKFHDQGRWIGVDISEADKHPDKRDFFFGNLPADRLMFSRERDLVLEPPQAAGPVNFLVYPYVEIGGQPHAAQKRDFQFVDLPADEAAKEARQ